MSKLTNKYATWQELATGFLRKFFPPRKTSQLSQKAIHVGSLSQIAMTLQLVDRSVRRLKGILMDVPKIVGTIVFPCDFVMTDILEDAHNPIILDRPYLAIAGVIIDVNKKAVIGGCR